MNRVFINAADYTRELNNYHAKTVTLPAQENSIYISSMYRFNHAYIDIATPEASALTMTVHLWNGSGWKPVADHIDETYGLTESGFVTWTPDPDETWQMEDTEDMTGSGLENFRVFNKYFVKITFTSTVLELNWLGSRFSTDEELGDEFPDLTAGGFMAARGVSSWSHLHIRAADVLVNELQSKNMILDEAQILERREFRPASVQKVAEMIYNSLGDAYIDQKDVARRDYYERVKKNKPIVDKNNNARVDRSDRNSTGMLTR